jgi:hypothetical protein
MSDVRCKCGREARKSQLGSWVCDVCQVTVLADVNHVRYAKTVMSFYDKFERAAKREQREHKAEVEREARKRW